MTANNLIIITLFIGLGINKPNLSSNRFFATPNDSFKTKQLKYSTVRLAYKDKEESIKETLKEKSISLSKINIYLRAFKLEEKLEVWAKNKSDGKYQLIKEYDFCRLSGNLGPKRKMGDGQVPEGYYHINIFNPSSSFLLSLGINYPNKSDKILGKKGSLGDGIFIHGSCVTIGCIPITDDKIKELYLLCVEAKNNGQNKIPITIFPAKLNEKKHSLLKEQYESNSDNLDLWKDLKKGYDYFEENKKLPLIQFLSTGRHNVK